jgi:hypothetical protein
MVTVSTARTGETDSGAAMANPTAARPSVVNIRMIILHVHSMRPNSMTAGGGTVVVIEPPAYLFLARFFSGDASRFNCAR